MDFNLTTEQQQILKGNLPRISQCLLARSGRAAASRATIATERVLHAHASRCGASPSGHWRLRACSPLSSPVVHRRRREAHGRHRCRQAVTSGQASVCRRRP